MEDKRLALKKLVFPKTSLIVGGKNSISELDDVFKASIKIRLLTKSREDEITRVLVKSIKSLYLI